MTHQKNIQTAGKPLAEAEKALIMLHGRGASTSDMLKLAPYLHIADYALLAPQATNHTWYPYSFLAKPEQNEPWLSSALELLREIVADVQLQGISGEHIYFLGFSQGACLALEFVTRHARRYGGVAAFTGGLIGAEINPVHYRGNFNQTPIFIGTGNPDPHVPLTRVQETADLLEKMHASVQLKVYDHRPHTVSKDEIDRANQFVFRNQSE